MISVTILTKNSAATLFQVLKSVEAFEEVVLVDTGSTDSTLEIAKDFLNVTVYTAPFTGFGPLHNLAANYASSDWILSLDSDEVLTPELAQEILDLSLNPHSVYSFPFHNFFNGKHIKWCGWYPDRHTRLYNKKSTQFSSDRVHERILQENLAEVELKHPVKHFSYRTTSDFLKKMHTYSDLFAQQNQHKKKSSLGKALLHGAYAFFKSYFLQRGFLGGKEGYIISLYNGHTAYYKYLKLYELNQHAADTSLSPDR